MGLRPLERRQLLSLTAALTLTAGARIGTARPRPPPSVIALRGATARWRALERDPQKRQRRSAWLEVVRDLEHVGRTAKGPTAALALLRAGHAAEELSRWSGQLADVRRAARLDLASARANPRGSLADDALLDAARLERGRLNELTAARHALERAAALRGDRWAEALKLLAALKAPKRAAARPASAAAKPSRRSPGGRGQAAYRRALAELHRLERVSPKQQKRDAWLRVIGHLASAAKAMQPACDGAAADFEAGRVAEALSGYSGRKADVQRAASLYRAAAHRCRAGSVGRAARLAVARLGAGRLRPPVRTKRPRREALALARAKPTRSASDRHAAAKALARADDFDLPPPPVPPLDDQKPAAATSRVARPTLAPRARPRTAAQARALAASVRALKRKALAEKTWSLSDQVGLKVRKIVIDAGHGGKDTGAIGPDGVCEKTVTLAIARLLAADLEKRGYQVALTRDSDTFVSLEERTRIANRAHGDLFISIHANASRSHKLHGTTTYSLNVASDRYAIRLAARENATLEKPQSDLKFLLADLATRADTVDSDRLAQDVQASIVRRLARRFGRPQDHGVKHALFYVLLGAKMPAVLVETAFISNRTEEKKLDTRRYQAAMATAIADGVDRFVARRSQLASIAY